MRLSLLTSLSLLLTAVIFVGCGDDDTVASEATDESVTPTASAYVLSNNAGANSVRWYTRQSDGSLVYNQDYATGGSGTGTDLPGVNGSLVYDSYYGVLYAVNTGSNSISAFLVANNGALTLLDTENSQGVRPVSLTVNQSVIYVVNQGDAGTPANVAGFVISGDDLLPILDSVQNLSTDLPDPAQIRFTPNPTVLVVSERANSAFSTFLVNSSLAAYQRSTANSIGANPGGFAFTSSGLMVSAEAQGDLPDAGSVSSYVVGSSGSLVPQAESVATGQSATTSALVLSNGAYAYLANSDSGSISTFSLDGSGGLALQDETASPGGPADLAVSADEAYLYSLNRDSDSISIFGLNNSSGQLTEQDVRSDLPTSAIGLAVR